MAQTQPSLVFNVDLAHTLGTDLSNLQSNVTFMRLLSHKTYINVRRVTLSDVLSPMVLFKME